MYIFKPVPVIRIAGEFVPGRIRTQENSYPKWLGTNSLVNSYPGTNHPENWYPIHNFYFDYIHLSVNCIIVLFRNTTKFDVFY